MSDLDIQIDVPDDDDLDSSVRVLSGDVIPPWLKAIAIAILGGLAAIMAAAFLLGRAQSSDTPATTVEPAAPVTELTPSTVSPAVDGALAAVAAWETFARDGDLGPMAARFDPDGPQYDVFQRSVADPRPEVVTFDARNLTEGTDDGVTTVSMDLVVSGPGGDTLYPYDFISLEGSDRVWTVIDRRSPGSVALPPSTAVVDAARQSWDVFIAGATAGDGAAATEGVDEGTRRLADQLALSATGSDVGDPLVATELYLLLEDRVRAAGATDSNTALISLLDTEQQEALVVGELTSWTLVDDDRIVAWLEVGGQPLAVVPFVASAEGWAFDLKSALESTGSTP